jgi:hypothetical protein
MSSVCVCDREYDSVTGTMNDYVCDWCQEREDQGQVVEKQAEKEGCSCQYDCEREDARWGDYRYQIWQCGVCAEEDRRQQKDEENCCFYEYSCERGEVRWGDYPKKETKDGCYCQYACEREDVRWGDYRYQIWECSMCAKAKEKEEEEQEEEEQEEEDDRCYCEYGYERGGHRWDDYEGGYRYLEWECDMCAKEREKSELVTQPSAPASKPVDPWATEKSTISNHLSTVSSCKTSAERIEVVRPLFEYILTIEPFLKTFPQFYKVCVAKVAELKADPLAAPITDILETTERFLASIA